MLQNVILDTELVDRRLLEKTWKNDYGKSRDYPKFKLGMHFDDFEKNKEFIYDILGKDRDIYNMTEDEKQELNWAGWSMMRGKANSKHWTLEKVT